MSIQCHDEEANDPKVYAGPNTGWYAIARVVYCWTDRREASADREWWKTTVLRTLGFREQQEPVPERKEPFIGIENAFQEDDVAVPLQETCNLNDIPVFVTNLESPRGVGIGQ